MEIVHAQSDEHLVAARCLFLDLVADLMSGIVLGRDLDEFTAVVAHLVGFLP